MEKKITIVSCVLWIAGLAAFIIGLNLEGDARQWVSVIGTIVFLVGLGLQGVLWAKRRAAPEDARSPEPDPENGPKDK